MNKITYILLPIVLITGYITCKYAFCIPEEAPVSEAVWGICIIVFVCTKLLLINIKVNEIIES